MFISFTTYNTDGQFDGSSFALEVKSIHFHGAGYAGWAVDLCHMDGQTERITIQAEKYGDFAIGKHERILHFTIVEYPACHIVDKAGFHDRVGRGRFLSKNGHYFVSEESN